MKGTVLVDLDGTLAMYDSTFDPRHIGDPIAPMVDRVHKWLLMGYVVKVFTARANPRSYRSREDFDNTIRLIQDWTEAHIGQRLEVTCEKDFSVVEIWDDRAVQVQPNTGQIVGDFWRHTL